MTYTSTEDTEDMRLVSKRRKDMAAWAVENFKTWPKPHELTDVDPEEIGCELVVLNQHHLPVLRCKLGGGYVDSTTWFYAKRNPKKMTQAQQPEALRLAHTLIGGKLIDDSTEWADTLHAAAADLRAQHARIEELEAQLSATKPVAQGLELANCKGGKWLTVVYHDIQPGDESRTIGEHPKVSALSWSHALHDRDEALAAKAKQGERP